MSYFEHLPAVRFEGPQSDNPFAFRHYDRDKLDASFKENWAWGLLVNYILRRE